MTDIQKELNEAEEMLQDAVNEKMELLKLYKKRTYISTSSFCLHFSASGLSFRIFLKQFKTHILCIFISLPKTSIMLFPAAGTCVKYVIIKEYSILSSILEQIAERKELLCSHAVNIFLNGIFHYLHIGHNKLHLHIK